MFSGIYYFLFIVTTECSLSHTMAKYSMKEMAEWHFNTKRIVKVRIPFTAHV